MTLPQFHLNIADVFCYATRNYFCKCLIEVSKKPTDSGPDAPSQGSSLNRYLRVVIAVAALLAVAAAAAVGAFFGLRAYYEPRLPAVASLHELKLGVPLRVFSHDGRLIGEFGAERRDPLRYEQIPQPLVHAFLAAEDDRFFEHPGVDWQGLVRASLVLAATGEKRQGGSTITMQLARNVFLTPERSFSRKIKEILLALKIERELNKQQILELYLNRIFLGNRAYGVGAAAQVYFGKDVDHLSLGEMATLAGLPKAPSRDNPIADPDRARERRDYVLRRMRDLRFVDAQTYRRALDEPITAHEHLPEVEVEADYIAEMARAEMFARYGEAAYTDGLNVTTTIDSARQKAATAALRGGILAFEERHGYRGPEAHLPAEVLAQLDADPSGEDVQAQLEARPQAAALVAGIVLESGPERLRVLTLGGQAEVPHGGFDWAHLPKKPLARGDIVRLSRVDGAWRLAQLPEVEGALIALDPTDGAVQALVGGFDFRLGEYNRVTQARRQPGSGFKPFLYTAALAKGYTPASIFLDAPVVYLNADAGDDWRPGNYEGKFSGPMRLRDALAESRNLVSIRVLQALGLDYALDFLSRFGLPKERLPHDLTLALGSATLTPWEVVRGYAVFANGGFLVDPYFIESVRTADGKEVFRAHPKLACPVCDVPPPAAPPAPAADPAGPAAAAPPAPAEAAIDALPPPVAEADRAPRTLAPELDYLITSMMHDVVTRGTGAAVRALGRDDLAGKTGTSNEFVDAWFNGFNPALVTTVWVGHDQPASLGRGEVGARAALPIWMDFMKSALADVPQQTLPRPPGLVDVLVNPVNGKQVPAGTPGAVADVVQADHQPPPDDGKSAVGEQQTSSEIY
ncbi:MAG: penicillin-binding protein 1A [Nevskia sp.]|nr:penicillin-binding protein 1A [Nevskia sp.]